MKVLILRNTVAGRKSVFVGDVVDLPEHEARELIQMKKATPAPSAAIAAPPPISSKLEEEVVETADLKVPEIETSVVKRGKRKE